MDASSQYVWNIKFINEIEKRPGIWNQSLGSRDQQKQLWNELSTLYKDKSVDSLKRKYKNLKLRFRQQLSAIPRTNNKYDIDPHLFQSNWPHYEQMLFLLNEEENEKNEKRKSTGIEENPVAKRKRNEDIVDNFDENQCGVSDLDTSIGENKPVKNEISSKIEVKPDIFAGPPAEDGLFHFLMGLYDCMNERYGK